VGYFLSLGLLPDSEIGQYSANTLHTVCLSITDHFLELIFCYENIIKPEQKGICCSHKAVTGDSIHVE